VGETTVDPMSMSCYVDLSLGAPGDSSASPISQLRRGSPDTPTPSTPLISFRDVMFSYATRPGHLCLKALNIDILNHSMTAIAGASGAGKSSMLALMCGLYRPTSGSLSLGGKLMSACSDSDLKDLRKKVCLVALSLLLSSSRQSCIC
jgi:ABC-type bacteriocin/lantibiotic exporter with double-glycine peptidase domain